MRILQRTLRELVPDTTYSHEHESIDEASPLEVFRFAV